MAYSDDRGYYFGEESDPSLCKSDAPLSPAKSIDYPPSPEKNIDHPQFGELHQKNMLIW